jgi:hypothetical protein
MEIQCLKHVFFLKKYYLHMCNSSFGFVYTSKSVFLVLHMCKFSVLVLHMPTHAYTPLHMSKKSEIASCMAWGFPVSGMERGLNVWHLIPINSPIKPFNTYLKLYFIWFPTKFLIWLYVNMSYMGMYQHCVSFLGSPNTMFGPVFHF